MSQLALQFSSQNSAFPATLFSSSRSASVLIDMAWHEEAYAPSLLADVQSLSAPVMNKQWDYDGGVDRWNVCKPVFVERNERLNGKSCDNDLLK